MQGTFASIIATSPPRRRQAAVNELRNRMGVRERQVRGDLRSRLLWALRGASPGARVVLISIVRQWTGEGELPVPRDLDTEMLAEGLRESGQQRNEWTRRLWRIYRTSDNDLPGRGVWDRRGVMLSWMKRSIELAIELGSEDYMSGRSFNLYNPADINRGEHIVNDYWGHFFPGAVGTDLSEEEARLMNGLATAVHHAHLSTRSERCPLKAMTTLWRDGYLGWLMDWIESGEAGEWQSMSHAEALMASLRWHAGLAQRSRQLDQRKKLEDERLHIESRPVVAEWDDGWSLRRLGTPGQMKAEGELLGHCIGGYASKLGRNDRAYYSLHGPDGRPRVTFELETERDGTPCRVLQVHGRGNSRPSGERAVPTVRAMLSFGFQLEVYAPVLERFVDLTEEQFEAILADPENGMNERSKQQARVMRTALSSKMMKELAHRAIEAVLRRR